MVGLQEAMSLLEPKQKQASHTTSNRCSPHSGLAVLQQVLQRSVRHLAAQLLAHGQQAQAQHRHCKGRSASGSRYAR